MLLGARQTQWRILKQKPIVDPAECKAYIQRQNKSDNAFFKIFLPSDTKISLPFGMQYIIQPLDDISADKKILEISSSLQDGSWADNVVWWHSTHIISGGWRVRFRGEDRVTYPFAGGSYDSRVGNIPVTANKTNWVHDCANGNVLINGQRIQDASTLPIKDQKYYISGYGAIDSYDPSTGTIVPLTKIQIGGVQDHGYGNLWHKFYRLSIFGSDMKPVCVLLPWHDANSVGMIDMCTGITYTTTSLNGSYVYGEDA